MCFCNANQFVMGKEISGFLFRETPPLYFGAPFVFQLWVMLSKDECYNNTLLKNSALPTSILLSSEPDNNSVRESIIFSLERRVL